MLNLNEIDGMMGWIIEFVFNLILFCGGEFEWDLSEVEEFVVEYYNDIKVCGKFVVIFYVVMKGFVDGGFVVM